MVIIFYDANDEKLYICAEGDRTKVVSINDPNIMDYVPNDDILYVQNGHFITKNQFSDWLTGDSELDMEQNTKDEVNRFTGFMQTEFTPPKAGQPQPKNSTKRWYIHPTANGTIVIEDIKTKTGEALVLRGKWHFMPIDEIGEDVFDESNILKVLIGKGQLEVVGEDFVQANKHKGAKKKSPAEQALDAILVPAHIKAEAAASTGGLEHGGPGAIEIMVEG